MLEINKKNINSIKICLAGTKKFSLIIREEIKKINAPNISSESKCRTYKKIDKMLSQMNTRFNDINDKIKNELEFLEEKP